MLICWSWICSFWKICTLDASIYNNIVLQYVIYCLLVFTDTLPKLKEATDTHQLCKNFTVKN